MDLPGTEGTSIPEITHNYPYVGPTKVYGVIYYNDPPPPGPPPPPPTWHYDNLGGSTVGDPDLASDQANHENLFVRGTDNNLWQKWWTGSGWSEWQNLSALGGGKIAGGPGAVAMDPGRFDVAARMPDNTVGHWYYYNSIWYFDNLGSPPGGILGDPDLASEQGGDLHVFVEGADENLWQRWWLGSYWSAWQNVSTLVGGGKIASGPGATSWGLGRFDVFARNPDSTVGHYWYEGSLGWHYDNIGGNGPNAPDAASDQAARVNSFYEGSDENLWQRWWNGSGWSEYQNLSLAGGGKIASGPGSVSWGPGRFDTVARMANGSIGHWWYG
jgi:hypothetical protein